MKKFYFKNNIQIEPLVNHWYAWPLLMSPGSASLLITKLHLKIMESYVQSPGSHEQAAKLESMRGGPIIDYETRQVDEVQRLIQKTYQNCKDLITLSHAFKELCLLLEAEAKGFSLEILYEKIPDPLKGYVELIYDTFGRASFRVIEALLYKSKYSMNSHQSILMSVVDKDERAFCLSTPRIPQSNQIHINLPFCDNVYDDLFSMKKIPKPISAIRHIYEYISKTSDIDEDLFMTFFEEENISQPFLKSTAYSNNDQVRVRYYCHACLLIESEHCSILTDPIISYAYNNDPSRFTYLDLPEKIDYLLITHAHQDHVVLEHLVQLRHIIETVIVPKSNIGQVHDVSLKLLFKSIGFKNVIEIDEMEKISIPGGSITGIPFFGEHGDLNIQTKIAYSIKQNSKTILACTDSNNIDPNMYKHVHDEIGDADIIFIGMECQGSPLSLLYGPVIMTSLPRPMDQSRRLNASNAESAMRIVETFNCRNIYIYAMGQEPWLSFITSIVYDENSKPIVESNKLIKSCKENSIKCERLFGTKEIYI